jgi:hypothetical protein
VYISWDPQEIKPKRPALMGPSASTAPKKVAFETKKIANPLKNRLGFL